MSTPQTRDYAYYRNALAGQRLPAAFHGVPAAGFALPITRVPRPGIVTCSGGGYAASGPAGTSGKKMHVA